MAITIIATPGHADANSYVTLDAFNTYLEARVNAPEAEDEAKQAALVTAALRLEQETYRGDRTSETQALAFPRDGETTIPIAVQRAQCEEAIALLTSPDRYDSAGLDAYSAIAVGPVSLAIRENASQRSASALAPMTARFLSDYLRSAIGTVRLLV